MFQTFAAVIVQLMVFCWVFTPCCD